MLGMLPTAAVTCAVPNRPAKVMRAAPVDEPQIAQMQGLTGTVVVIVTLAPDGTVTDARVSSSPSSVLNASALAAARASTYEGAIRDCVPVGATSTFYADYSGGLVRRIQGTANGETEAVVQSVGYVTRAADGAVLEYAIVTIGDAVANVSAENGPASERFVRLAKAVPGVRDVRTSAVRTGRTRAPGADAKDEVYAARVVSVSVAGADIQRIAEALTKKDATFLGPVTLTLNDERAAEREAAANALRAAERDAASLAKTRGLRVVRLRDVKAAPPRWERFAPPLSAIEGTPSVEVLVAVTATFLLGPP
jgi:TonB family protein